MPIFRVKSVKIYTGQKNLHWRRQWRQWQLSGMEKMNKNWFCILSVDFYALSTHPHSEISALACIMVKEYVAQVEKPFGNLYRCGDRSYNPFTQHISSQNYRHLWGTGIPTILKRTCQTYVRKPLKEMNPNQDENEPDTEVCHQLPLLCGACHQGTGSGDIPAQCI